jgi:Protein of unknown function (DUF2950)
MSMKWVGTHPSLASWLLAAVVCAGGSGVALCAVPAQTVPASTPATTRSSTPGPQEFNDPDEAADALIAATKEYDYGRVLRILGPGSKDVVFTPDRAQDRRQLANFNKAVLERKAISRDPHNARRAMLIVGHEDWPFPAPIVERKGKWSFDMRAGRRELLNRRIGANELDAIAICEGYVQAQYDYAYKVRSGYQVAQYAQRIISTPGKQDGLAWQNPDGSWGGPIGEKIAHAIAEGSVGPGQPYHGYYFKILKGQGPAAPLGKLNYVIEGVMIGGFALMAAPAQYGVSGIKTFMVSQYGVVYQKDFGPGTSKEFARLERFNPDKSWTKVRSSDE